MNCSKANLSDSFIEVCNIKYGKIYFFENLCVLEVDEGVLVDFENSKDVIDYINHFYKDGRPFGIILNRIHSYSINLAEVYKFKSIKCKPFVTVVVSYDSSSKKFLNLENHFWESNRKVFSNLHDAEKWVLNQVKNLKNTVITKTL